MPGVAFFFEANDVDVWSGRPVDLDAWRYAIRAAGDISRAVIVNRTGASLMLDGDMRVDVCDELPDLEGRVAHIICPWNPARERVELWGFDHAVDWYVFGPAGGWQHAPDLGVYVPQAGHGAPHAVHVASVVMMHRYHAIGGS